MTRDSITPDITPDITPNITPGITPEMTLFDITEKHPETIDIFVANGFAQVADAEQRRSHGKLVTLAQAVKMKDKDLDTFTRLLEGAIQDSSASEDITLTVVHDENEIFPTEGDLRVAGLLPCPVRIPLLEAFDQMKRQVEADSGLSIGVRLAAASIGAGALQQQMQNISSQDDLPHVFLSAGFEAFFDRQNLARFKDAGVFVGRTWDEVNPLFADYDLRDPDGHFAMLGVVPAVFLVDTSQLAEGEDGPRSWHDLLDERYIGRIALPVGDFDLFNGVLLTLWKKYGDEAITALARNMQQSLHPSQASGRFAAGKGKGPLVSVIPYFFSKMAKFNPQAEIVWPEDGAIISPIFMLLRREAPEAATQIADFFNSRAVGEILAHKGLFPSCHPEVTNPVPEGARFMWLGWDFIREHDLGELIPRLDAAFKAANAAGKD